LADPQYPKTITAGSRCPELEHTRGTGDCSGALLLPIVQQDDERFQYWGSISIAHSPAEYLLAGKAGGAEGKYRCGGVERPDRG
jgi:hypothetical protein